MQILQICCRLISVHLLCVVFSSDSEFSHSPEEQDKLGRATLQLLSLDAKRINDDNQEDEEDDDEEEEDADDVEWDWKGSVGGDITKRYTAMRTGNSQQVCSRNIQEDTVGDH